MTSVAATPEPLRFEFTCAECGHRAGRVGFLPRTGCEACGASRVETSYRGFTRERLDAAFAADPALGLWRFRAGLPIADDANIVTAGEGNIPIEPWPLLEGFAERHAGVRCRVYVDRHDLQPATGSVKDLAGSLVASALKEHGIGEYVVCSTGNIGTSFASYFARAGITLHVFVPDATPTLKEAEIGYFGQQVYRVRGDYTAAKRVADAFAASRGLPQSGGTFDPFRIEAKRTMVFRWLAALGRLPNVYVQPVSGGTGPLAVAKGVRELLALDLVRSGPRLLLSQPDGCDPMYRAYRLARQAGFPARWERDYAAIENPKSTIANLATGDPVAYPQLAPLVRGSGGDFLRVPERLAPDVARLVALHTGIAMGPAAAIGVGGFFSALRRGAIGDGDMVLIAVTDGVRRDPQFMVDARNEVQLVDGVADCRSIDRSDYARRITAPLIDFVTSS